MKGRLIIRNSNYTDSHLETIDGEIPIKLDTTTHRNAFGDTIYVDGGIIQITKMFKI